MRHALQHARGSRPFQFKHQRAIFRSRLLSSKNHYDVLQVPRGASRADIKHAYLRLAKEFHPDLNNDPTAASKFRDVSAAYEVLGDAQKRLIYDQAGNGDDAWHRGAANRGNREHERGRGYRYYRSSDAQQATVLELLLGPTSLSLLALSCIIGLFASSGTKKQAGDSDIWVEDCWLNPKSRRLEPPAPWDEKYKEAAAAGMLRRVRRSQLSRPRD